MQTYYDKIVPNSVLSGKAVVSKALFKKAFLTLTNYEGKEFLKQAPLALFQTIEDNMSDDAILASASTQEKDFKSFTAQKVNYPKSYINVATAVPVVGFDQVFLISIYYVDPTEIGKPQATLKTRR